MTCLSRCRESVEWLDRREGRVNEVILDPPDDGERGEFLVSFLSPKAHVSDGQLNSNLLPLS